MTYPSTVIIIRHAEETSDRDDPHLSELGQRRAEQLPRLFGHDGQIFGGVDRLVATDRSRHSNRCVETLRPLAAALDLGINHEYDADEYRDLARRLRGRKYSGATVLIAWHHERLPALAKALGVRARDLPARSWPDDVYDQLWVLRFNADGLTSIHAESQGLEL